MVFQWTHRISGIVNGRYMYCKIQHLVACSTILLDSLLLGFFIRFRIVSVLAMAVTRILYAAHCFFESARSYEDE